MDTVNRVVETASKAIWGEQNEQDGNGSQATASSSQNQGITGIESIDKVFEAGKKAIWGETADQSSTPHGEEPVAGKRGLGTATDPYDAGNRDEQPGAPPVEAGGLTAAEQRIVGTAPCSSLYENGISSGTAAGGIDLGTTATGLRPDPSTVSTSSAVADAGPSQSLKHTISPLEEESQKLAKDLQDVKANETTAPAPETSTTTPAAAGGAISSNQTDIKHSENDTQSSSPSVGSSSDKQAGQKSKTKTLEKVKNKLHIGHHSPKTSS